MSEIDISEFAKAKIVEPLGLGKKAYGKAYGHVNVNFGVALLDRVDAYAKETGRNRSETVRAAVIYFLDSIDKIKERDNG